MLQFSPWKTTIVLLVCLLGLIYAGPNLMTADYSRDVPNFAPGKKVSLGLDLQGGSYLLLKVELDVVIEERLESITAAVRQEMRKEKIGYKGLGVANGAVRLTIRKPKDVERARVLLEGIEPETLVPETVVEVDDAGNASIVLTEQAAIDARSAAVQQSIEIVRRRIDETGAREPSDPAPGRGPDPAAAARRRRSRAGQGAARVRPPRLSFRSGRYHGIAGPCARRSRAAGPSTIAGSSGESPDRASRPHYVVQRPGEPVRREP